MKTERNRGRAAIATARGGLKTGLHRTASRFFKDCAPVKGQRPKHQIPKLQYSGKLPRNFWSLAIGAFWIVIWELSWHATHLHIMMR
jgi:hypothetical protein